MEYLFESMPSSAPSTSREQQGARRQDPAVMHKIKGWWGLQAEPSFPRPHRLFNSPNHWCPAGSTSLRCRTTLCCGCAGLVQQRPSWPPRQSSHGSSSSSQPGAQLEKRKNINYALTCKHGDSPESWQVSLCPGSTRLW